MPAELLERPGQEALNQIPSVLPVSRWVLRIGIFLLPLAFLPDIVDEFVLPKLLLARLLVVVLAVMLLIGWLRQGAITWRRTPLDLPLIAFIGSAALSTIFAINHNVAIFGTYDRWEGLLTIVTYALLFWLAAQLISGEADARGLTWSLLSSAYFIAAVAILQSGFGLLGGGHFADANGIIRADATLAHPDFLGIFLAMLLPVAVAKLVSSRPLLTRILAANLIIVLALGLLLTYTRGALIAAVIGLMVVLSLRRRRFHAWPLVAFVAALMSVMALLGAVAVARTGSDQARVTNALYARIVSIADLSSGSQAGRVKTWQDTLPLIASRPIIGYGPDTFGLVYPRFQTSNRNLELFDKPHEESLGIAATQGVVGLLAYLWILVAFVRAFWAGRHLRGAVALFGGWVAYEIGTQVNFSYIPTSAPFWLFAAAAVITWAPTTEPLRIAAFPRKVAIPTLAASSLVLAALAIPAVMLPYLADADYYLAQRTGDLGHARSLIAQARTLAPYVVAYAVQAGDLALNLDSNDNPAPDADWAGALEAYRTAARLGSYFPETFRHLAITDEYFGDHVGALAAARRAVELDRYDPKSQALLAKLTSQ